jgi:hypothetical protein
MAKASKPEAAKNLSDGVEIKIGTEARATARKFFAVGWKRLCFSVVVKGEDGKPIPKRDGAGNMILRNGKPVPEERALSFKTLSEKPEKMLSVFVWEPDMDGAEEILERLEEMMRKSPGEIMTEEEYRKGLNPEAFALRKRNDELADENDELMAELTAARAKISALENK